MKDREELTGGDALGNVTIQEIGDVGRGCSNSALRRNAKIPRSYFP